MEKEKEGGGKKDENEWWNNDKSDDSWGKSSSGNNDDWWNKDKQDNEWNKQNSDPSQAYGQQKSNDPYAAVPKNSGASTAKNTTSAFMGGHAGMGHDGMYNATAAHAPHTLGFHWRDMVGISLQLISVILSAFMKIGMNLTKAEGITKSQLVDFQYATNFAVLIIFIVVMGFMYSAAPAPQAASGAATGGNSGENTAAAGSSSGTSTAGATKKPPSWGDFLRIGAFDYFLLFFFSVFVFFY